MYEFERGPRRLAVVRLRGRITDADIERVMRDTEAFLAAGQPFAFMWDISDAELPARDEVMRVLRWVQTARQHVQIHYDQAIPPVPYFSAYYMPSMWGNLLRFFLQMIPSLRGQQMICQTVEQGRAACEAALDRFELLGEESRPTG